MFKTYHIIPFVFILFLFGFTLITESPVFAQGQWGPSMEMRHPDRHCMKNGRLNPRMRCAPDPRSPAEIASDPYDTNNPASIAARALQDQSGNSMQPVAPSDPFITLTVKLCPATFLTSHNLFLQFQ